MIYNKGFKPVLVKIFKYFMHSYTTIIEKS